MSIKSLQGEIKGIIINEPSSDKDLAIQLKQTNQLIASQRQEINLLSKKAHHEAVAITSKEIPIHVSSDEKKKKMAA